MGKHVDCSMYARELNHIVAVVNLQMAVVVCDLMHHGTLLLPLAKKWVKGHEKCWQGAMLSSIAEKA